MRRHVRRSDADAGGATGEGGAQAAPWYQTLPEALHGAAKRFTKPKTLEEGAAAILESNQSLRADLGERPAKDAIVVPGEDATPEAITRYREARGIPEKPEQYHLEGVDVTTGLLPGESAVDADLLGKLQKVAHDNGMTQGQFTALVKANTNLITGRQQAPSQQSLMVAMQEADAYLREHFGDQVGPNKVQLTTAMQNLVAAQGEDAGWLTEFFDLPVQNPTGTMVPLKNHPMFLRYMFVLQGMTGGDRFVDPGRRQNNRQNGNVPDNPADFGPEHMTEADYRSLYGDDVVNAIQTGEFRR